MVRLVRRREQRPSLCPRVPGGPSHVSVRQRRAPLPVNSHRTPQLDGLIRSSSPSGLSSLSSPNPRVWLPPLLGAMKSMPRSSCNPTVNSPCIPTSFSANVCVYPAGPSGPIGILDTISAPRPTTSAANFSGPFSSTCRGLPVRFPFGRSLSSSALISRPSPDNSGEGCARPGLQPSSVSASGPTRRFFRARISALRPRSATELSCSPCLGPQPCLRATWRPSALFGACSRPMRFPRKDWPFFLSIR